MFRSLKRQLFMYLICSALILSVIFTFIANNNRSNDLIFPSLTAHASTISYYDSSFPKAQANNVKPLILKKVIPSAAVLFPARTPAVQPSVQNKPPVSTAKPIKQEQDIHKELVIPTYEVTSYYLNVRSEPNSKSKILSVVQQGTELKVVSATANGWLQLKDGGYVHGAYAAPLDTKKSKSAVTILSAAPSRANSTVSIAPKPLIVKKPAGNPARPTTIVKSDSGLTAEHIALILKGTKLAGQGLEEAILDIEDDFGINAFFTIAVMKLESGNGKSRLSRTKNNLFGLNAITGSENKKAFSFATKGDSVRKFGQLLAKNYVGKGLTTIEKVAKKYCPANGRWSGHVKSIMKSDFRKLT
ncbi:glucosaminidase domain-containing protein [Paenibacillus solisilvae]|uniref:Glucosaminidase domain-containing protein n=1 Tax=Paenibacillus solisilvae TaxID=2486751 RepID=A0ABW0W1A9_9BACL